MMMVMMLMRMMIAIKDVDEATSQTSKEVESEWQKEVKAVTLYLCFERTEEVCDSTTQVKATNCDLMVKLTVK